MSILSKASVVWLASEMLSEPEFYCVNLVYSRWSVTTGIRVTSRRRKVTYPTVSLKLLELKDAKMHIFLVTAFFAMRCAPFKIGGIYNITKWSPRVLSCDINTFIEKTFVFSV